MCLSQAGSELGLDRVHLLHALIPGDLLAILLCDVVVCVLSGSCLVDLLLAPSSMLLIRTAPGSATGRILPGEVVGLHCELVSVCPYLRS